jgi:predicted lipid-binding transport protein (Tim44 family)
MLVATTPTFSDLAAGVFARHWLSGIQEGVMTNVFGSLQSLIWLLIVIVIIAVVVWAVRMALAPREPRTYAERPVVQALPAQAPPATSGLAPGWYPDQNDPDAMRYFDGRVWTSQTEPRR